MKKIFFILILSPLFSCFLHNAFLPGDYESNEQPKIIPEILNCIYVNYNSGDDTNNGSKSNPKKTIQNAIDTAFINDIKLILVSQGNYESDYNLTNNPVINAIENISILGSFNDNFSIQDKNLYPTIIKDLSSAGGTQFNPTRAIYCDNTITNNTVFDNLIIEGGTGSFSSCAVLLNGSPIFQNCIIQSNNSGFIDYGIFFQNSQAVIKNCNIYAGTSNMSISIYSQSSNLEITSNNIYYGQNSVCGMGIESENSNLLIQNNFIQGMNNNTNYGIYLLSYSSARIYNNLIYSGTGTNLNIGLQIEDLSITNDTLIRNNTIDSGINTGNLYGIYILRSWQNNISECRLYIENNIIVSQGTIGRGIYEQDVKSDCKVFMNNNLFNFPNGLYSDVDTGMNYDLISQINGLTDGQFGGDSSGDPNFSDQIGLDYHLTASTAGQILIGGKNGSSLSWDFNDDKELNIRPAVWSMGCYQY